MDSGRKRFLFISAVAVIVLFAASNDSAPAQAVPAPAAPRRVMGVMQPGPMQIPAQQIDMWIFRQDRSPDLARQRQVSLLNLKMDELNRTCRLTPEQSKKLNLTGQGDIKRFFDRCEALKEKVQFDQADNQDMNAVLQETNPLAMTLQAGLFQPGSLFQRAIPNTLSAAQLTAYEAVVQERLRARHSANILLVTTTLEEAAPLPDSQRKKLISFLNKEIKPARVSGSYDFYYLVWQLGTIPEDKLKPFFDANQWRAVERFVSQYRNIEPTLRQAGYLQDAEENAEKADAGANMPNK